MSQASRCRPGNPVDCPTASVPVGQARDRKCCTRQCIVDKPARSPRLAGEGSGPVSGTASANRGRAFMSISTQKRVRFADNLRRSGSSRGTGPWADRASRAGLDPAACLLRARPGKDLSEHRSARSERSPHAMIGNHPRRSRPRFARSVFFFRQTVRPSISHLRRADLTGRCQELSRVNSWLTK
jgi:hypothetical protein